MSGIDDNEFFDNSDKTIWEKITEGIEGNRDSYMSGEEKAKLILIMILKSIILIFLVPYTIMLMWDAVLVPKGLPEFTYWNIFGLYVLCSIIRTKPANNEEFNFVKNNDRLNSKMFLCVLMTIILWIV